MSKAFDTVSKPAMMIAWLRLGVPEQIATWLVGLDMDGVTIVRTPSARRAWQQAHYQGIRGAAGNRYKSGETAFADDMESTSATNSGMQDKANVVSAFCLIFGLRISPSKLRRYFQDWSNNVGQEELTQMTVYTKGWIPNTVEIEVDGVTSYLGAKYEIQTGNQPQMLQDILDVAREHCNAIQHTSGSTMSKLMYRQLDTIFSVFYRKITSNMPTIPTALIYTSTREGEQMDGKCWQATEGLLERASRQGGIHIGLDSYIVGCMDINETELGSMNQWGINKLADLYTTTKQGMSYWHLPPELQLDRLKQQCPPIRDVVLDYSIQQGGTARSYPEPVRKAQNG
eukprot:gene32827-40519_t